MGALFRRIWRLRNLLWLAVPLALYWALRGVSLEGVLAALSQVTPGSVIVLLAANAAILLAFSSRWWLILRVQGYHLSYWPLAGYRLAAFAISYFTPGTQFGGEPFQVYLLRKRHGIPLPVAAASVTLDKLLELLSNFAFLLVGLLVILQQLAGRAVTGLPMTWALLLAAALLALPAGYLLALGLGKTPLAALLGRLPARLRLSPALHHAGQVIAATEHQVGAFCRRRPRALFTSLLFSTLIWLALAIEYWLALRFLGTALTLPQAVAILTAARLAFLLPLPAGLGVLEASQVIAAQALGLPAALGISLSLLIRARDLLFGAIGLGWAVVLPRLEPAEPLSPAATD